MGFELADLIYSKDKPLSHMRIAITALDLEQSEHRGIAYLSKANKPVRTKCSHTLRSF